MKKWKWSFFITLTLLIVTNLFWFYSVLDVGVTYTYQQVSLDDKAKSVKMLGELIVKGGQIVPRKRMAVVSETGLA